MRCHLPDSHPLSLGPSIDTSLFFQVVQPVGYVGP